ncbi:GMC family oxidoreductase [Asticcacaulis sp. 201]|uniref:GMC family oxidoreductase n=1 Tax=Asticcacaulis sp. 201 TaxID=3028787 RepID=UPI002915F7A1|nr:GMC family oxidoreductase [Asticcacaulis sp. 201]MDV6331947.1 GMC family oxidoreductase [Asticcacaulis sp. 201]
MAQTAVADIDVIIVGSGAGGAMSAYVLTRAGIRCLMLEAGRDYDPGQEVNMFGTDQDAPLRGVGTPDKPFGYYDATIDGGWEVPGEPYTQATGQDFKWWRSRMLGGRTNHWARHVPRFGPYDFKGFSRDGQGVDWPIDYDTVAPFYDRVEQLIGVCGGPLGLENHPDSPPEILHQPPKPRVPELLIAAAAKSLGIPCVGTHTAVLTRDMPDDAAPRSACYNATDCGRGCNIGAAFQTTTSLLPMAKATGRLKVVTDAMVSRVVLSNERKADGVEYVDRKTGQRHIVRARAVILAASACETARLLLNSKTAAQPNGLANGSGQVGRNLTDTTGAHIEAVIPGLAGRPYYNEFGINFAHMYIPWWLYKAQQAGQLDFPRGYHFEIGGRFGAPGMGQEIWSLPRLYGSDLKRAVRNVKGTTLHLSLRGEMVRNDGCYAEIDPAVTDRFGIPVLKFHWQWTQAEYNQIAHGQRTARAIFSRLGGIVTQPDESPEAAIKAGGEIIHEAGVARMGADPRTSVTDQWHRTWEVPNLRLHDGSVFASNPHKNLTLTIMALAMRSSEHLAAELKTGGLA